MIKTTAGIIRVKVVDLNCSERDPADLPNV